MRNKIATLTVFAALTAVTTAASAQVEDAPGAGPNPHLLTTGLFTMGVAYTPAVLVAVNSPRREDKYLYAPLAGPWLDLANRAPNGDDNATLNRAMLVVDGVIQAMGALEILASFALGRDSSATSLETESFTAHLVPAKLPHGGYGVTARGNF